MQAGFRIVKTHAPLFVRRRVHGYRRHAAKQLHRPQERLLVSPPARISRFEPPSAQRALVRVRNRGSALSFA
jgi:hypothetical protein